MIAKTVCDTGMECFIMLALRTLKETPHSNILMDEVPTLTYLFASTSPENCLKSLWQYLEQFPTSPFYYRNSFRASFCLKWFAFSAISGDESHR